MNRTAQSLAQQLVNEYPTQALDIALDIARLVAVELSAKARVEGQADGKLESERKTLRLVKHPPRETAKRILAVVADNWAIHEQVLLSPVRTKHIVQARRCAMRLMRARLQMSLTEIGDFFNRDHTTAMAGMGPEDENFQHCSRRLDEMAKP